MRDFLPAEKKRRDEILHVIRDSYQASGFDEIETPAVEDITRLRGSDGGDNTKMTFDIIKRRLTPEKLSSAQNSSELVDLGLRFDLTVPLSRFYEENKASLPSVFKSIQIAPVWRAERPQKGRYRQFIQCDIDIIGEASSLAEVELITVTASTLKSLGLSNFTIRMNDRELLNAFLDRAQVPKEKQNQVLVILDKMDKLPADKIAEDLEKLSLSPETVETVMAQYTLDPESNLASIITSVNTILGEEVAVFDPTLVRGMGYYTGTIFEGAYTAESYSLGGGGRYDKMISGAVKGSSVPAVGFSLGFERIIDLVEVPKQEPQDTVALIYSDGVSDVNLLVASRKLIADGARVRIVKKARNTKKQLNDLALEGFNLFAFVNETDADKLPDLRPLSS